ncbi:MAG: 4Fe-4S binding protein [Sphaerochaetaceae bacterium]
MKKRTSVKLIRRIVQIIFFLLIFLVVIGHYLEESGITIPFIKGASLHAVCPVGGVVTIYQYITTGTFVQKVHEASFYLMIIVFLTAIIAGTIFCGWVCPFGSFQEWISYIGKKIFHKKYNHFIPKRLDSILRYLRYLVLIWVLVMTAISAKLVFANFDPYFALFNFWTGEVAITGYIALGLVIVLSLFVERPFCKYACPYGALLGLTNFFRIFSIRRNQKSCISCKACDKACPMNIEVSTKSMVKDHQCISCLACTSEAACPIPETLDLKTSQSGKNKALKLDAKRTALLLIVIILGGIFILSALGLWKTESTKTPVRFTTGEFAGLANPSDIRGSYTFEDIEKNFAVPATILAEAFALDTSVKSANEYKAKDLETFYQDMSEGIEGEVGTDSVRLFVSLYLEMPYEPEETTLLPNPALNILRDKGLISDEKFQLLKEKSVSPTFVNVDSQVSSSASVEKLVKGQTTFLDLLDWGMTKTQIEEIMGKPYNSSSQTVRDFSLENGLEFSDYKEAIQKILDTL